MSDAAFRIVLLLLLLSWSGFFVYRLATGAFDVWKVGRFGVFEKNKPTARAVRLSADPVRFWFTMAFWHVMLVGFVGLFIAGIYGVWRVIAPR